MVKVRPGSRKGRTKFVKSVVKSSKRRAGKAGKAKLQRKTVIHDAMREAWDETMTPANNLNRLGLQSNVNAITKHSVSQPVLNQDSPTDGHNDVDMVSQSVSQRVDTESTAAVEARRRLEQHAALPERGTKRIVRPGERSALQKLVDRYGDDWTKMSRDRKLNYLQWTPSQLKKKIQRMQAILAEQKA